MNIEKGLVDYLTSNQDLKPLVGVRVFLMALPQKTTLPAVRYQRISTSRLMTHDQTHTGLATARFQFDIYGNTYGDVKEVALALQKALLGYKGSFGTLTAKVNVGSILADFESDAYEADLKLYTITVDYMITYEE